MSVLSFIFKCLLLSCPVLSVCLSVCDVGVLWPNGFMDKDETWHASRPRPRLYYVRWGHSCSKSHKPQFSAHVCCGQTAGRIKLPLGREVDLAQRTLSVVAKRLYESRRHYGMVHGRPRPRRHCVRWGPALPLTRGTAPHPHF